MTLTAHSIIAGTDAESPSVEAATTAAAAAFGTYRATSPEQRADFLAMAVRTGITLHDLATMENVYSPPIGALNEPIALAAQNALSKL